MATTDTFVVSPGPGEPLDFYEQLRLEDLLRQQEEARRREEEQKTFAPPLPVLPEVPVEAPGGVPAGFIVTLAEVLGRLIPILVPQPTGPAEHDELDEFDVMWTPPPPTKPPPASTDPIMPPNWNDLVEWPGTPIMVPITPVNLGPVEMPPGEPDFIVSPPKLTPRDDVLLTPPLVEVPDFGDFYIGVGARPGPTPTPTSTPGSDPVPLVDLPYLTPGGVPRPDLESPTAPDIFSDPLPDVIGNPFGDPFTPETVPSPPGVKPGTPTIPDLLAPTFTPDLMPEPTLPQFQPEKPTSADTCNCAKKKKKKPRKERDVCYRGTYVETKKGLRKTRLEEISCTAPPAGRAKRASPSGTRKPKLKPGQFPGLGFMGSENLTSSDWLDLATHAVKEFAPIIGDFLKPKKAAKPKKLKKGRKPKTRAPRLPGTFNSTPFPYEP